jgi:hypothetical protein
MLSRLAISSATPRSAALMLGSSLREATGTGPVTKIVSQCDPKGQTFLMFPSIVLNPPWAKSHFLKLRAIEVLRGHRQSIGGGLFEGESLLTAQFQYNFNLL